MRYPCFARFAFTALLLASGMTTWSAADESHLETLGVGDARRSADAAVEGLDVYAGLEAKLFAAEPEMLSPTNIDVDDRGRVWVVEVVNYAEHGRNDLRPEGDRILILEDEDGDGTADSTKVFYQGRDIDSAMGLCVLGNKVIVTRAPNIIVFTDKDGDDKPDQKKMLFTESGGEQNDHSLHSFSFGPDGKFYWNMGNSGRVIRDANGEVVRDKLGRPVVDRAQQRRNEELNALGDSTYWGGMVFRCEQDGSQFEVLAHNFRNNYEAAVDSFGNVWQTDNDDDGNRGCRINFILEGGNYGYRDELTGAGWRSPRVGQHSDVAHRHWHQNDPGVVPNFAHTGAGAPAGIVVYEGNLLPKEFRNQVISCDAGPGVVWAALARPRGAGFANQMVTIAKGERDRWCRPIDVAVAPDGALYVSDWYDPYVGWNRQGDVHRGRIYRIAPKDHVSKPPAYDYSSPDGAALALTSPNASARYRAWMALHAMQGEASFVLKRLLRSGNPRIRARAIWLLCKIEGEELRHIIAATKDPDPQVRAVAVRAARQADVDLAIVLTVLLHDKSPVVRRECAIAIREFDNPAAGQIWAQLAAYYDEKDRWYLEALGIGAEGRWDDFLGSYLAMGVNVETDAVRDIIWRSRSELTPRYLGELLRRKNLPWEVSAKLLRAFDFQADSAIKTSALERLAFHQPESQTDAMVNAEAILRLERGSFLANLTTTGALQSTLEQLKGTPYFARLVRHLELNQHYPALLTAAMEDPASSASVEAVRAIVDSGQTDIIMDVVRGEDADAAVKATRLLGRVDNDDMTRFLVSLLTDADARISVRMECVRSLVQSGEARLLLGLAERGEFPDELKATAAGALAGTLNVAVRAQAGELFPMPPTRDERPIPQMTDLLVFDGDVDSGRQVFVKGTCATCHIANGVGVDFGPELSKIGAKLSKRGLYEAILNPGSGIATSYEAWQVVTEAGKVYVGLIVSETELGIALKVPGGQTLQIEASDIAERTKLATSAMPNGLAQLMTLDELIDLVEYLTTLK